MASKADNDAERFARIDSLMEEYRINHEDLETYLTEVQRRARAAHERSQRSLREARKRFEQSKRRKR